MALKARLLKKRIGSIGSGVRSSQTTKATSSSRPPTIVPSTVALVQPSASARTIPNVTPSRPAPPSARPGRSRRRAPPCDSRRRVSASGVSTSPTGTLIQKIQCHEMPSTTAPPASGPSATPRPLTPDQMPSARPRLPAGNASDRSVSDSGITIAAPAP